MSYCTGLFTSITIYRLYFHRLSSFPGPCIAGFTKFWHVWKCRRGKNHLVIEELRQQYGSIIRTGPEELTIIDPSIPGILDGPKNEFTKAVWYDFLLPEVAVNTTRDKKHHDARRRIWDRGFSPNAMAAYEQQIIECAGTLAQRIAEISRDGEPVVVTDWFYWFTFDVMGHFAFARSFGMLRDEQWHLAVKMLRRAMALLGPFSPVPWLAQVAFHFFPWMTVEKPDISHWLIDATLKQGSIEADRPWLNGDAIAIIIAGSDTVAPGLVFAFYELACNPSQQDQLLQELQDVDIFDRMQLQQCTHLNAVINETLRLYPPVPTGGYRQSPPAGMVMNGTYIPGNVTIVSPRYSLGRLESCYEHADRWIPERWTTRPEMVKDARGFSPFAQGRYSCVGKVLAMVEMRLIIAMMVKRFEISLSGDKGESLFSDLRDQFTAAPGRLELRFHSRG
ncbi:Tryprostatin B 6-hydroxylase [Cytospora mali]|uniref:Tryprostatin B 6-hydroxylase n=1 Tax=Cytospora mali TaxID=578113 RepID=A0A194W5Y7_CYTMA|nr:Tryprostatin B 6-hydroxylase [Valsa mali]